MDILKLIETDHKKAKKIVKQLEKLADKPSAKTTTLARELWVEVKVHAQAEEKILYTACQEKNETLRDFALEGHHEHRLLDEMLDVLVLTRSGPDGEFKAALSVVQELLEHHAEEEEEKEMFPKLRRAFKKEDRELLGAQMEDLKTRLKPKLQEKLKSVIAHVPRLHAA
jgi:hypothetical protein